ncbi:hypothetical protein NQ318_012325 [Aromia moschata]|uniref:Uncharacterized protein n=1 Tax=Aromia moschata TaxID=1265417 RepID=A0AAV8YIL9_9CUCU|nr:hypothetical protein NQ318_012325 [Aromia moschata]
MVSTGWCNAVGGILGLEAQILDICSSAKKNTQCLILVGAIEGYLEKVRTTIQDHRSYLKE